MSELPSDLERDAKVYVDQRKEHIQRKDEAGKLFVTWLLTLSGANLGLLLTFSKDFALSTADPYLGWLIFSWICLTLCLVVTLINLVVSEYAFESCIDILDREFSEYDSRTLARVAECMSGLRSLKLIDILRYFGLILFLMGLFGSATFVTYNLLGRAAGGTTKQAAAVPTTVPSTHKQEIPVADDTTVATSREDYDRETANFKPNRPPTTVGPRKPPATTPAPAPPHPANPPASKPSTDRSDV
jgi:hypothetical protein